MRQITSISILVACLIIAPVVGQEPRAKFGLADQKKQLEAVFDKETVKTIKGGIGTPLPNKNVMIQASEGGATLAAKPTKPLPRQVQGLPLDLTVLKLDNDEVQLIDAKPSVVTSWRTSSLPKSTMSSVNQSMMKFDDQFQKYLQSDTPTRAEFKSVLAASEEVQDALMVKYAATPSGDTGTLNALARISRENIDFQRKAQFDQDDNYWPEVYAKMHLHSRSVVAIALKDRDVKGTGTLIGTNLILTCKHVFTEDIEEPLSAQDVADFEVWFDYEETSSGRLPKMAFPVTAVLFDGKAEPTLRNSTLDYVLLKIGPDADGKDSSARGRKPLPLTKAPCYMDDPVYVIGHPRGGVRTIHDNARVHFPFRMAGLRKTRLDAQVRSEIETFVTSKYDAGPERDRNLEELYKGYLNSFVKTEADFKYVNEFRGPAIGIDSDTYGGDSGAPTCLRRGSGKAAGLIGVYVGGATQSAARANWLTHEVVLPITVIISQLDTQLPNWQAKYGVDVQAP